MGIKESGQSGAIVVGQGAKNGGGAVVAVAIKSFRPAEVVVGFLGVLMSFYVMKGDGVRKKLMAYVSYDL